MSKYSDSTFDNWRKPSSETEEQKISNAMSMIKDGIKKSDILQNLSIETIVQGSYANNTNVRLDSDIDVAVMLKDTFYTEYPKGATDEDYGFSEGTNQFSDFRRAVIKAMEDKFGKSNVSVGNKSIKIDSNSYHVQADVVPCFQYRNYRYVSSKKENKFVEGIKFYSSDNEQVINYPKEHISNGINKNTNTKRRYKRLVRLFKRIRNQMKEDGVSVSNNITSFLLECLIWNVSNTTLNTYSSWNELLRESIRELYFKTKEKDDCKNWGEVSEHFYLFHSERKWSRKDANAFLVQMWNFLGYSDE